MQINIPTHLTGLTKEEVEKAHKKHGYNELKQHHKSSWLILLLHILKEPMLLILIAISIIYVLIGDYGEALFMFIAIIAVSAISLYQDSKSIKALEELEKLNEPLSSVVREKKVQEIPTHEITIGDLCIVSEGRMINADGKIVHSNDFSVNESTLTGESYSVFKNSDSDNNQVYSGTLVSSGLAVFQVEKIGKKTKLGQISESIKEIEGENSPLQRQITNFVKWMAVIGGIIFLLVWGYSYYQTKDLLESLLVGLTLAMSVLPEEIPVAFTTFMALGAWKLMKEDIIIKRSNVVETLGSTTVVCADKTGTITENVMILKQLYNFKNDKIYYEENYKEEELEELISYAMWSSEPVPFDPMEKTIHYVYEKSKMEDVRRDFEMIHEYPLEGKPPMMTHLFENEKKERIIAAKGAPEAIIDVCQLSIEDKTKLKAKIIEFAKEGFRLLGVAKATFEGNNWPKNQQDFNFEFLGFTIFFDPPKPGIASVFEQLYEAGVKVKVITGDNPDTTRAIAFQAGITNSEQTVNGVDIIGKSDEELMEIADSTTLFTRMFPESKLKMVNIFKQKGEVVAMLGDGVNDGPALKAAHIGVAMGTKGTETAKAAADLIITNDDLGKLIVGIEAGRRIYSNLKKAIRYIISIHIPIMLAVALPLFLGWIYPHIFTPVHVIFLELIMGPTCSIVYESEPAEKNAMQKKPRKLTEPFLNAKELTLSIIQGLMITAGILFAYQYTAGQGGSEENTRAMVFTTLIFSNILLSFTNRSFYYSVIETFKNRNVLLIGITGITLVLLFSILYIEPIGNFFKVEAISFSELLITLLIAGVSVLWIEGYKFYRRKKDRE